MGGVAIEDGGVAVSDLSGVVHDDDLGGESLGLLGRVVLGVRSDISTTDILELEVIFYSKKIITIGRKK